LQAALAAAPLMLDNLCDGCAAHFAEVRMHLDALGVTYVINPRLVRGLDYYTKTTFEFVHPGLGAQSGMGGGGRYDGLMAELGGQPLSGIGFGLGIDRTILAARTEGLALGDEARVDVYLVPLGYEARARCVVIAGELRQAGVRVDLAYGTRGLKGAMKGADRSGARFAVVMGERDLQAGEAQIKDLRSTDQAAYPLDSLVTTLKEKVS
jgi:histidyl-tRNA synthetase